MTKNINLFPLVMKATALCSGILSAILFALHSRFPVAWLYACAITALTVCYHFTMRLCVGAWIPKRIRHDAAWFRVSPRETALYSRLKVRKWKKHVPSYHPDSFSLSRNTPEQVISNMCRSEVVHEVIMLLSFVPLLFSLVFGEFFVFFLTSVLAAAVDGIFVSLQRYNRPRMQQLLSRSLSHE